jgi:hypothetical protein
MSTAPAAPAWAVERWFNVDAPLTVVGLHTVFEHHDVMGPDAEAPPTARPS